MNDSDRKQNQVLLGGRGMRYNTTFDDQLNMTGKRTPSCTDEEKQLLGTTKVLMVREGELGKPGSAPVNAYEHLASRSQLGARAAHDSNPRQKRTTSGKISEQQTAGDTGPSEGSKEQRRKWTSKTEQSSQE